MRIIITCMFTLQNKPITGADLVNMFKKVLDDNAIIGDVIIE